MSNAEKVTVVFENLIAEETTGLIDALSNLPVGYDEIRIQVSAR